MNTNQITAVNTAALKEINKHLYFTGEIDGEPLEKRISYSCYQDLETDFMTILEAIETIGFNGAERDLSICGGLAQIAKKMFPTDEINFLDRLLINKSTIDQNPKFKSIKNL